MPRRRGISNKQRSAQSVKQQQQQQQQRQIQEIILRKKAEQEQQEQQQRRRKTESDAPAVCNGVQRTISAITNHVINQDGGAGRYLHKKFKKVVEVEEAAAAPPAPTPGVAALAAPAPVNGHPPPAPAAPTAAPGPGDTTAATPEGGPGAGAGAGAGKEEAGAGRHVCPYCNMACAKPSVLEKHIRAHTNERPYPCEPCGFRFKTMSNLYKHQRSHTHTRKMEEVGANPSLYPQLLIGPDDEAGSSDGREDGAPPPPAATPSSALPGQQPEHPEPVRNIYKPKFHPAAFQYNEEKENGDRRPASVSSESGPGPGLGPGPEGQSTPGLGFGLGPRQSSTPSPETLQRHISKLILENKAIVDAADPLWAKKYSQRISSSNSPAGSTASSPAPSPAPAPAPPQASATAADSPSPSSVLHKKFLYRQFSGEMDSRLALALTGHKQTPPPTATPPPPPPQAPSPLLVRGALSAPAGPDSSADAEAPLNLSKPVPLVRDGTLDLTQPHKRHSPHQPAPAPAPPPTVHQQPHQFHLLHQPSYPPHQLLHHQMQPHQLASHHQMHQPAHQLKSHHLHHLPPATTAPEPDSAFKRVSAGYGVDAHGPHASVDGSVIKDILLKSRAAAAAGLYLPTVDTGTYPMLPPYQPEVRPEDATYLVPPGTAYQCPSCKTPCRSPDALRKHVMYCSKTSFTQPRVPSRPPSAEVSPRAVVPPQPSPGPLLGNTPLVDSYNALPVKRRRLDSGGAGPGPGPGPGPEQLQAPRASPRASPRSLTSPSSFPAAPAPGPTTPAPPPSPLPATLRSLEELSRSPHRSNSLQMFGGQVQILDNAAGEPTTLRIEPSGLNMSGDKVGAEGVAVSSTGAGASPQQMVVTIAKSGLQTGGGTIVQQVPASAAPADSSSAADHKGKSAYMGVNSGSGPSVADATHLVIPFIPNIATPNLAIKGIPAPSHLPLHPMGYSALAMNSLSHHVAMGHPLPMGDPLLNPLTSITAFNPLTLAAQPPPTLSRPPRPVQPPASSPLHSGASTVTSSSSSTFYGGNVLTIVCDGRAIPHVPGMPGPASQLHAPAAATPAVSTGAGPGHFGPAPVLAAPAPTPAASPVYKRPAAPPPPKESVRAKQAPSLTSLPPGQDRAGRSPTPTLASPVPSPVPSSAPAAPSPPRVEKRNFSMFSAEAMRRSEAPGEVSPSPSLPSIRVESAPAPLPGPQAPDESSLSRLKRLGSSSLTDERDDSSEKRMRLTPLNPEAGEDKDDKDMSKNAVTEATRGNRFLRPTSLPLKPGTFTPKRHLITPNVLSLVSPETPRPKKSYGQLYLNGHAYTYLGLKCSTRPYFCTLNRLQPTYVPLSPDHNKLSMYSNWKVYDPDPDPCGLTPNQMIALYDSRHRPTEYSVSGSKTNVRVTHSSYWLTRVKNEPDAALDVSEDGTNAPKRIKICAGGFESSEEYTYIRGRGRGRYVCEECGIRCKKPSMLKKHIRTHTDVRPFTCRHCSFSFKTKGNLTKHMKSKAHYKKCKEEGIDPVPTVVDDSYIDEACLARQQAMRDEAGVEDEDSDDDEDEEDDDAEEDDDDDEDEAEADIKGRQEREAAKSLLSLAQTPHHSPNNDRATEKEAREAGLVAPKGARGLSTYPYQLSTEHPRRITSSIPGTPTLAAISEHKEREKVSHNTGLARDIHEQGIHVEDGAKPLAELNTEDGHQRYYFPSSRIVGGSSSLPTDTIKQESKDVDGADSTNSDDTSSKFRGISGRIPTALLTALPSTLMPRTPTTPISEILTPVSEPAFLLASLCSTMEKLPVSLATPTDPPEDSALHQTYLRERAVQDARVKQSQYHPRSRGERSEDTSAVILGTPTSCITPTMSYSNALSHTDTVRTVMCSATFTSVSHLISSQSGITAQESTMLRPPPLFWAAQTTSKVNDSDPRLVTSSNVKVSASLSTSGTSALPSNLTSTAPPVSVKQENVLSPVKVVPTPLTIQSSSTVELSDKRTRTISGTDCASDKILLGDQTNVEAIAEIKPESFQSPPVTCGDKLNATLSVITTVSASGNDASSAIPFTEEAGSTVNSTGSRSSTTNSVIVANSGSTSPPQTSGAVVKKPKAEFMPPSSGPAPSYVSVTDDGRSKCTICNKVFSKPSQLHLHVNIHYFERPYRCDSCVVSFRTQGHLQKHQRSVSHHNKVSMNSTFGTPTTTNPRPYKCDDCKVAFRIHGHLAKHLRSKMHIMKLECVGKLPFGTYAEIERAGLNMNDIDTTDCDSSLESLLALAKKLCEKDPTKLNQWKQPEPTASDIDESSDEGEPILFHGIPFPDVVDTGDEDNATSNTPQSDASHQNQQQPLPPQSVQQLHHNQHQHLPPRISSPNQTPSLQQSGASSSAVKQDGGAPRTNTTAAAAAAAAVAAAAAAASAPASRVFPGISAGNQSAPPPPGSNGVPTYMPATIKMDVQSSDKAPILTHLPGMMAGRYNSVNSHSIIHNSKDVNPEIKSASLDRRIVHLEQTHDLQDKTVDSRTGVCEVPNKTDIAYGGQSLQPPANR